METSDSSVRIPSGQRLFVEDDLGGQIPKIDSGVWPAFPADLTSIAVTVATQAYGTILIFEKMFESRLFFVDKLVSMGARIILCDPHRVVVTGPAKLYGQRLESPDIRAGMAMVLAALAPRGRRRSATSARSTRGYERIDERLRDLGALDRAHRAVTSAGAARIDLAGGDTRIATGVVVLDHLLQELGEAGGFGLRLEIAPDDPETEVAGAGKALGEALAPLVEGDGAGRGFGLVSADEALAMVVVEASGRPLVVSNADLTSTRAGGLRETSRRPSSTSWRARPASRSTCGSSKARTPSTCCPAIFKALGIALAQATKGGG